MAVAVSAIATAVGAWGTAAFIGAAATAAMETGLALTVIGAATGSKDLMKAGSVLGIVGGGVGLAAGAGMFGEAIAAGAAEGGWAIGSSAATNAAETGAIASPVASGAAIGTPLEAAGTGLAENGALAAGADAMTGLQAAPTAMQTGEALGGEASLFGAGGNVNPVTGQAMGGATDISAGASSAALDPNAGIGMADPLGDAGYGSTAASAAPSQATAAYSTNPVPPGGDPTGGQIGTGLSSADKANMYSNAAYGSSTEQTLMEKLKSELGAQWNSLGDMSKAMILKSAMAIPGGIQAQSNKAKELAMMQQKVNQTSYGSQVPTFGLINKARGT